MAADVPTLAVVGIHQQELGEEGQERAVEGLVEAIESTGKLNGITPDEVAGAIAGREPIILEEGLLGEGRRFLADGRNLYNQAQPEDAVPVLEQAVDSLRRGIAATNTTRDLWEAWVYLGTSHLALEASDLGREAFGSAVALNPGRSPNPAQFPPDVVGVYAEVREALEPQARTVFVATDSPGEVWLDGEQRGNAPAEITGVLPGEHHIVARGNGTQAHALIRVEGAPPPPPPPPVPEEPLEPGAEPAPEPAPVPELGTLKVPLAMGKPSLGTSAESKTGRARQTASLYQALGKHAQGVDLVLLAGTDESVLHLQLYAPNTEAFSKPMEIPYVDDADDEAIQTVPLLLNFLDKSGALPPSATSAAAAPLFVGTNSTLAQLLTQPTGEAVAIVPSTGGKRRGGSVLLIGGVAVLTAAALGGGGFAVYSALNSEGGGRNDGVIQVGPF